MFEPKIVAFLCTWCSYTGADTAGIARLKSPANLRAVRVPCSGRVSPELILRTFDQGADGVLVLGCHIGECHYDTGNHRTAKRLPILRALLSYAGLEPERLRLDWVSASEGERFARITNEFVESVRGLGPVRWRVSEGHPSQQAGPVTQGEPRQRGRFTPDEDTVTTGQIRTKAVELLTNSAVSCVIGYETDPRGRVRPAFVHSPEEAGQLAWNAGCTHNLTVYLREEAGIGRQPRPGQPPLKPVAVVVKPCDSRTVNVLVAEGRVRREMVYLIGVACQGIRDVNGEPQKRCQECTDRIPLVYDTLVGEPPTDLAKPSYPLTESIMSLEALAPAERMGYWLSQFDRCIRCYACRQACPLCKCPTCLYERDDSLWVGMGITLNEKRTFHLGRAFHLAGRCVGCNECERACPMGIPISLLNLKLAQEVQAAFGHRAGLAPVLSPVVTVLPAELQEA